MRNIYEAGCLNLPAGYLRHCKPSGPTHTYEQLSLPAQLNCDANVMAASYLNDNPNQDHCQSKHMYSQWVICALHLPQGTVTRDFKRELHSTHTTHPLRAKLCVANVWDPNALDFDKHQLECSRSSIMSQWQTTDNIDHISEWPSSHWEANTQLQSQIPTQLPYVPSSQWRNEKFLEMPGSELTKMKETVSIGPKETPDWNEH